MLPEPRQVFVETGAALAFDDGAAAWSFDLDLWGRCVQSTTSSQALREFRSRYGTARVAETIHGDEQAFVRDLQPLRDAELEATLSIHAAQRARAVMLASSLPAAALDHVDEARALPSFARWRTIRQMLWHVADTESRYYLPSLGLSSRPRAGDLLAELATSAQHVRTALVTMPRDVVTRRRGEVWTATKMARRLAWHERGELDAIEDLLLQWNIEGPAYQGGR